LSRPSAAAEQRREALAHRRLCRRDRPGGWGWARGSIPRALAAAELDPTTSTAIEINEAFAQVWPAPDNWHRRGAPQRERRGDCLGHPLVARVPG
jgi:hypothetical protein